MPNFTEFADGKTEFVGSGGKSSMKVDSERVSEISPKPGATRRTELQIASAPASRNAGRIQFVGGPICPRCDRWWKYVQSIDSLGRPHGRPRPLGPHCTTCCSNRHWACAECGQCLPRYLGQPGDRARFDRRTCSSACRQRAYRRRRQARASAPIQSSGVAEQ
jgi:hypothetical protein